MNQGFFINQLIFLLVLGISTFSSRAFANDDVREFMIKTSIPDYVEKTKKSLKESWHPSDHSGISLIKAKITLHPMGRVENCELIYSTATPAENREVYDLLLYHTYFPFRDSQKSLDWYLSFMSQGANHIVGMSDKTPVEYDSNSSHRAAIEMAPKPSMKPDFSEYTAMMSGRIKRSWTPVKDVGNKPVILLFTVYKSGGAASDLSVKQSSGIPATDEACIDTVKKCLFRPLPINAKDKEEVAFTFDCRLLNRLATGANR